MKPFSASILFPIVNPVTNVLVITGVGSEFENGRELADFTRGVLYSVEDYGLSVGFLVDRVDITGLFMALWNTSLPRDAGVFPLAQKNFVVYVRKPTDAMLLTYEFDGDAKALQEKAKKFVESVIEEELWQVFYRTKEPITIPQLIVERYYGFIKDLVENDEKEVLEEDGIKNVDVFEGDVFSIVYELARHVREHLKKSGLVSGDTLELLEEAMARYMNEVIEGGLRREMELEKRRARMRTLNTL